MSSANRPYANLKQALNWGLIATGLLGVSGCVSLEKQAEGYSSNVLCYGQYAGNVQQQQAAAHELYARNFACGPENIQAGMMEWQAIQNRRSAANAAAANYFLNRSVSPPPPQPPVNNGTQTYIINGRTVTCTTFGTVTDCR